MLQVTCDTYCLIPLLANSMPVMFTGKFLYLQILTMVPLQPNSITCKFLRLAKIWFYHQSPIRANSKTTDLLPTSITCILHYLQIHSTLKYICQSYRQRYRVNGIIITKMVQRVQNKNTQKLINTFTLKTFKKTPSWRTQCITISLISLCKKADR